MNPEDQPIAFELKSDREQSLERIGLEKIQTATIMVVGAGAVGNEVLKNLALMGVGNILIVDFDIIEQRNLMRSVLYRESDVKDKRYKAEIAAERIKELNPEIQTATIHGDVLLDVGLGVFKRVDVVIGCLDNRLARLYVNRFCQQVGTPWVDGGIMDLGGQLTVYRPGEACYECGLSQKAWDNITFAMGCANRAMRYASSGVANTIPVVSSVIGAMMTQEALKLVGNPENPNSIGDQQFYYEGGSNSYYLLPTSVRKAGCQSHQSLSPFHSAPTLSCNSTVGEALAIIEGVTNEADPVILLHYDIVLEVTTEQSEQPIPTAIPRPQLSAEKLAMYAETSEDEVQVTKWTSEIDRNFSDQSMKLHELGIAPLHILTVIAHGHREYVELSADVGFIPLIT